MSTLVIGHFNDVYEVEDQGSGKGASRFYSAIKAIPCENPLILFSGDCFSPSHSIDYTVSQIYKGADMVEVFQRLGVHCACIGNHDLDFGLGHLRTLISSTGFPWVQSNLTEVGSDRPIAGAQETLILTWSGWKIGLFGLAEREWLDIIGPVSQEMTYTDFQHSAKLHAAALRAAGCDIVIALTHMRTNNDLSLAEACEDIDLILGGHDHLSKGLVHSGCPVIKSGSDFEELTTVEVSRSSFPHPGRHGLNFKWSKTTISRAIPQDPDMEAIVQRFVGHLDKRDKVLAVVRSALDCRFSYMRSSETEIGDFLADVIRWKLGTDIVLVNSGHVRLDGFIPAGNFTEKIIHALLPVKDHLCEVHMTGSVLLRVLNCAFEKYPSLEGRFPIISGLRVTMHTLNTPRVTSCELFRSDVTVGEEPLDLNKTYSIVTQLYVAQGHDGYTDMRQSEIVKVYKDYSALNCLKEYLQLKETGPLSCAELAGDHSHLILRPEKDGRICIL